jgi:hypothetical protein
MRTTEQVLAEQRRVADANRRHRLATKGTMPAGLTPLQQTQWRIWGWYDQRQRSKPSKYNFETRPEKGRVAPPSLLTADHDQEDTYHDHDYS